MHTVTRLDLLLQTFCDLMPADAAARISTQDPNDYRTFADAYYVVKDLPTVTPLLKRLLESTIFDLMDAETGASVNRRRQQAAPGAHPDDARANHSNVIPLMPTQRTAPSGA